MSHGLPEYKNNKKIWRNWCQSNREWYKCWYQIMPKYGLKRITHTHPFNGPLSGTTRVGPYQKVKTIWILLKQETVSGSGISWAICKSAPSSRHHASTPPLSFLQAGCPSCRPTNSVKALKAWFKTHHWHYYQQSKCGKIKNHDN